MHTTNTIKGHGFADGDTINFYGMGRDLPTNEPTTVRVGKVGNKYMLTTTTGELMTWEFGATAKIHAATADEFDQDAYLATVVSTDQAAHEATYAAGMDMMLMCGVDDVARTQVAEAAWSATHAAVPSGTAFYSRVWNDEYGQALDGLVNREIQGLCLSGHNRWPYRIVVATDAVVIIQDRVTGEDHKYARDTFIGHLVHGNLTAFVRPIVTEAVEVSFRTHGKVKTTSRSRRYRRGA